MLFTSSELHIFAALYLILAARKRVDFRFDDEGLPSDIKHVAIHYTVDEQRLGAFFQIQDRIRANRLGDPQRAEFDVDVSVDDLSILRDCLEAVIEVEQAHPGHAKILVGEIHLDEYQALAARLTNSGR